MSPAALAHSFALCVALVTASACEDGARLLGATARPAGTGTGQTEATVRRLEGSVRVHPRTGPAFAAAVGQRLLAGDELAAGPRSAALLELNNGHIVRVSDAERLRVGALYLLNAPAAKTPLAEQEAALLALPAAREAPDDDPAASVAAPAWLKVRFGPSPTAAGPVTAPTLIARQASALQRCVSAHVKSLGLPNTVPNELRLYALIERARVAGIALEGAVPVPACARDAIGGFPIRGLPAVLGWMVIPLPLIHSS